jgi:lipid II isoglutaminyl synthase (glutamine-hydrolysing)
VSADGTPSEAHGSAAGTAVEAPCAVLHAVHLYPATMNTYGDRGNVAALTRRAVWRGIDLVWHPVELGEPAPTDPDLVFMGGGQDRVQHAVAEDLAARRQWLAAALDGGAVLLGVCAGLQLLGRRYVAADGSELEGLGLLDLETEGGDWRLIGNVVVEVATPQGPRLLAGFENHGGRTRLTGAQPLGRVVCGRGNNGLDGTEGARSESIRATYLHGPVLPKNAWFTDELLALALRHAGHVEPLAPLDDTFEDAAQREAVATARREQALRQRRGLRGAMDRARDTAVGCGRAAAGKLVRFR